MSVREKWTVNVDWTAAFGTSTLNSLTNGNALISDVQIDNSTNLDTLMDVSFSLGSLTTGTGVPYIGLYLYPLNQDGSTYGDSRFGSSAAGPPPMDYQVAVNGFAASTTAVLTGCVRGIVLPPGKFKLVLHNGAGANLASSANTVKYRTYNRVVGA